MISMAIGNAQSAAFVTCTWPRLEDNSVGDVFHLTCVTCLGGSSTEPQMGKITILTARKCV